VSGLPGLLLTMGNADRTEPLTIIGPKGVERVVNSLRVVAPDLPFPIEFIEIEGAEQAFSLLGLTIEAFRVKHNVVCYGYSICLERKGKFDADRAKEQGIPLKCWNPLQKGETVIMDGAKYTPDMVLGPDRKGIKLTYCTDTRPVASISEHAKGSDLFVCEGMYGDEEEIDKARSHKHMTFAEAAKLAKEADVSAMWLTHYSPSLVHPENYLKSVRKLFKNTELGEDGKSIELNFED
jgi:ribonuclease Z